MIIVIGKEANLTWLYITAIVVGLIIVLVSSYVLLHYRSERKTNKEAIEDREKGVSTWGVKMLRADNMFIKDDYSDDEVDATKSLHGKISDTKVAPASPWKGGGEEDEVAE